MDSSNFKEALDALKGMGIIEGPFAILGGRVRGILRTFPKSRDPEIRAWAADADDGAFMDRYERYVLACAIAEINGTDFRSNPWIDVSDPTKDEIKKISTEHYLRDHVINTWGDDARAALFKMLMLLAKKAEGVVLEGVAFDDQDIDKMIETAKRHLAALESLKKKDVEG